MGRMRFGVAVLTLALVAGTASAGAVYLDYTNMDTRLDELASSAGITSFTATEKATIKSNIKSTIESIFSPYTGVSFTTTDPGAGTTWEEINFGLTASPGALGLADRIDYRNQFTNDTARVYTANFGFIIESGDSRATQIDELSMALAGTGAHELGHNLGLRHFDAYGDLSTVWGVSTGGTHNTHIMATGSTGLGEIGRESLRDWSDLSALKLDFADGVLTTPLTTTTEQVASHGTVGTAQGITFQSTVTSGYEVAANVEGSITQGGEVDFYSFSGNAGDKLLAHVIADLIWPNPAGYLTDAFLQLYGTDGTTLLWSNDDINYNTLAIGAGTFRTFDSLILNYVLPSTGIYYLKVSGLGSASGTYDLLVGTTISVIPLPSALGLGIVGLIGVIGLRRRKHR